MTTEPLDGPTPRRHGRVLVATLAAAALAFAGCGGADDEAPATTANPTTTASPVDPVTDASGGTTPATTTPARTPSRTKLDEAGSFVEYIVGTKSGGWDLQRVGTKVQDGKTSTAILVVSDTDVDPNATDFTLTVSTDGGGSDTLRPLYVQTFRDVPRAWIVAMNDTPGVVTGYTKFEATNK